MRDCVANFDVREDDPEKSAGYNQIQPLENFLNLQKYQFVSQFQKYVSQLPDPLERTSYR